MEERKLDINLNGIKGVDEDMIKDTIDNGDTEDAKMWITELQNELYYNGLNMKEVGLDDIMEEIIPLITDLG